ncbi:MAG: TPM domain-containing protein [Bacteroidetes bacterium]|nr:MAG: TPM domain-containing protein [Bacteroidota bacterium]
MKLKLKILPFLLLLTIGLFAQKQIPNRTSNAVNDFAGLLSVNEQRNLEQKLRQYQRETSTAIVIVSENSLQGEDEFDYSNRLAQAWGIGTGENDNGILIYIAQQERRIRIQTGYGAEGFLPDAMAKRIIDNIITPYFRQGNYYGGLDRATSAIMDLGRGEYDNDEYNEKRKAQGGSSAMYIFIFLIVMIILFSMIGGGDDDDDDDGGYYRGGRYDDHHRRRRRRGGGFIIFPGGGFGGGGGGGGGFGGGGFGGFGGGGFGGGGAGGGW